MVQNDYIGLLDADSVKITHPITKRVVKLYRVIAMKTFKLDRYDSVILDELDTCKRDHENLQNTLSQLNETQENLRQVIDELTVKEEFKRVNELRKDLEKNDNEILKINELLEDLISKVDSYKQILDVRTIEKHTIGGYVESIDNLDPDNPVWVDHRVRVFDNAKILNGSLLTEGCVVFGNCIIDSSRIKNYARIHGNANIIKTTVKDLAEVKGNTIVKNTQIGNSAMIFENAQVTGCILETGSCVRGKSIATKCILKDTAQIQGESIVNNCRLSGRAVILDGEYQNESFYEDYNLKTESYIE